MAESFISSPEAPSKRELSSECETEGVIKIQNGVKVL